MEKNPIKIIDAILADWTSPRVRRTLHGLLSLALIALAVWFGVEQDWREFVLAALAALYTESNRANTNPDYSFPTDTIHGGDDH